MLHLDKNDCCDVFLQNLPDLSDVADKDGTNTTNWMNTNGDQSIGGDDPFNFEGDSKKAQDDDLVDLTKVLNDKSDDISSDIGDHEDPAMMAAAGARGRADANRQIKTCRSLYLGRTTVL